MPIDVLFSLANQTGFIVDLYSVELSKKCVTYAMRRVIVTSLREGLPGPISVRDLIEKSEPMSFEVAYEMLVDSLPEPIRRHFSLKLRYRVVCQTCHKVSALR